MYLYHSLISLAVVSDCGQIFVWPVRHLRKEGKSVEWLLRVSGVVLCLVIGWMRAPVLRISSGDVVESRIRYVALGDSIAYGYGLRNREQDSYVGRVRDYLETQYDSVFCSNLGTNGLESGELLERLTDESNKWYQKYRANLRGANIVTISIGSNDLLHLLRLDGDMGKYLREGDAVFRQACEEFAETFPRIIQEILEIAPGAAIYVDNVYNPCRALSQFESMYDVADRYISLLNGTFDGQQKFVLVDIKKIFDNSEEKLLNVTLNGGSVDPHPNTEGHRQIADAVIREIIRQNGGSNY